MITAVVGATALALAISLGAIVTRSTSLLGSSFVTIDDGSIWLHSAKVPYRGSILTVSGDPDAVEISGFDAFGIYWRFIKQKSIGYSGWTLRISIWYLWLATVFTIILLGILIRRIRLSDQKCLITGDALSQANENVYANSTSRPNVL